MICIVYINYSICIEKLTQACYTNQTDVQRMIYAFFYPKSIFDLKTEKMLFNVLFPKDKATNLPFILLN